MLRYLSGGRGRKGCRVTPSRRVARVSRVGVQRVVDSICCTVTLLALSVASGSCSGDDRQPAAATSAGPTVLHDTLTPVTAPGPVQFQDAASRPPGLHHGFLHASASRRARLVGTADLTCGSRQVPAALYEYALTLPRPVLSDRRQPVLGGDSCLDSRCRQHRSPLHGSGEGGRMTADRCTYFRIEPL
jgi:hypothetical protein